MKVNTNAVYTQNLKTSLKFTKHISLILRYLIKLMVFNYLVLDILSG